ncbi:MAG: hemerythrin domain-containing protein [Rikenellaceae bacterium]
MKYNLFSSNTKVADMILQNHTLLDVLPRFEVSIGVGEDTIEKLCDANNINPNFFAMVCNIHTFDCYTPSEDELQKIELRSVIDYLQNSHDYYKNRSVSLIGSKLSNVVEENHDKYSTLLCTFFEEYKQEIFNHFYYEENIIFPYVNKLIDTEPSEKFRVEQYEDHHASIDDKLSDLKNIILKYQPHNGSTPKVMEILTEIFLLEDDLRKHTRIEEKVLTPLVKLKEKGYEW